MIRELIRLLRSGDPGERSSDADLLTAFADANDAAAFDALVRRHGPMVFGTCRRILRHEQDAEDAFQATFLVLARRAADVWPREAVGPWLHGVACRVAGKARTLRAARQAREGVLPGDVAAATVPTPEPDLPGMIDHAIRRLPAAYRAAVVACDLEGLSRADAAARLGWKEGTLSGRLARGRRLLADRLRRQGATLPAAGIGAVVGAGGSVEAGLVERTAGLCVWDATVPVRVETLSRGVGTAMFAEKVRLVVATAMVAGVGLWVVATAGGQPDRPAKPAGSSKSTADSQKPVRPKEPTDAEKDSAAMQGEWISGLRYLAVVPTMTVPKEVVEAALQKARRESHLSVTGDKLMWQQQSFALAQNDPLNTPPTSTLSQTTYSFRLDPSRTPKWIDLTDENGNVTRGVYNFQGSHLVVRIGKNGKRPEGFGSVGGDSPTHHFWQPHTRALDIGQPPEGTELSEDSRPDYTNVRERLAELRTELAALDRDLASPPRPGVTMVEMADYLVRVHERLDAAQTLLGKAGAEWEVTGVPSSPKQPAPPGGGKPAR